MGVTGLWKLIEQSGKEVLIDSLENRVIAIDISIWLHQVIKGFQDKRGSALQNAHLLGLFNRLCKLLYYRIKPIFVFDGSVPALKYETIAKRQQGRTKIIKEVERIQELMLEALNKEKIVQHALEDSSLKSFKIPEDVKHETKKDEGVFTIPDYLSPSKANDESFQTASSSEINTSLSEADSLDESSLQHFYNINLQNIDIKSAHFKSLPADVRLEILADIRQMRKQHSWGRLNEMPTKSDNFSDFQMKRLLKRRQVQVSLEQAEKELEGRCLTLSELETFLSEQGIVTAEEKANSRINSDANTRFLLVKDLKQAIENAAKNELMNNECTDIKQNISESKELEIKSNSAVLNEDCNREIENDKDLQLAIQLSLAQSNISDKECESLKVSLNREMKNMFKNATGSAKDYLMKYGLIKNFDLDEMDESQVQTNQDLEILDSLQHNKSIMADIIQKSLNESQKIIEKQPDFVTVLSDDSDSDLDFIEVNETDTEPKATSFFKADKIQIHLDPSNPIKPEEDLFADIFSSNSENCTSELKIGEKLFDEKQNLINEEKCFDGKINQMSTEMIKNNEEDMSKILLDLQKEASEIVKLSLEDIKLNSQIIEIPDSQENKTNNILNLIEETKDSEANKFKSELSNKLSQIEIFDSQEQSTQSQLNEQLSSLEVPDSQEIALVKSSSKNESVIEILDSQSSENQYKKSIIDVEKELEVIEIIDDCSINLNKTPSKQNIQDFFEIQYKVIKTPTNEVDEKDENISKIQSPFFIKKSPSSSNKKKSSPEEKKHRSSKVSKALFEENEIKEKKKNEELMLIEKASELRNNKSKEELATMVTEIDKEKRELEKEKNRQDRMGLTVTEKMTRDCMDLLKLFGVPYIIAPMEAEAQCAFLEDIQLTDGTITDDSDIWLFGGKTVYKNFFDKQKHVLQFKNDQINRDFSLNREKLIQLAFLVGSDYTIGIKGIGTVTALEILAAFPSTPAEEKSTTKVMSVLSSLRKFRDWFKNNKNGGKEEVKMKLKCKLKNVEIADGFPNLAVADAYLYPRVDDSKEPFSWGTPDVETIRQFTRKTFGWTQLKTDETLGPVLRRLEQRTSQTSIKNFFTVKSSLNKRDLVMSKRVQKAVNKMSSNYESGDDDESSQTKKIPAKRTKRVPKEKNLSDNINEEIPKKENTQAKRNSRKRNVAADELKRFEISTTLKVLEDIPDKKSKLDKTDNTKPRIPRKNIPIPQRENEKLEMEKRKEVASALFKRTRANVKTTK